MKKTTDNLRSQQVHNAVLALANGLYFCGKSFGANVESVGEVIFNTSMTGYQEILTDPSYHRQIIVFTAPHIGNTGINLDDIESAKIYACGIIIHSLPTLASNWRKQKNLPEYLIENNIPAISGIDTRKLTRVLRTQGAQAGAIVQLGYKGINNIAELIPIAVKLAQGFGSMSGKALAYEVTSPKVYDWQQGQWTLKGYQQVGAPAYKPTKKVAVIDFGIKYNILRRLVHFGCEVRVFPAKTSVAEILAYNPDGIMLSNGPGDPEPCIEVIENIKNLIAKKIPIFGICLGHQLLGIAVGGKCSKMKFGHHGANHPVLDLESKKVMITSQNHGFAIDEDSLPKNIKITHRSLFDNTVQGIAHESAPVFTFQGHPEASPGPQDIDNLFIKFVQMM